jgi:hypothetical protein
MTNIIAFSGRKQSGKSTACNFILGYVLSSVGVIRGSYRINEKGELYVSDLFGNTDHEGIFDYFRQSKAMDEFKAKHVDQHVKIYSFADMLKREVAINILGLSYDQVFGTDEQKNSPTNIKWSDCPGVITEPLEDDLASLPYEEIIGKLGKYYNKLNNFIYHKDGYMTAREVLQYIGTEVFRRMVPDCWADATIRRIVSEGTGIAVICDCRFPNECDTIHKAGGVVVRFTRNSDSHDIHLSETALDDYNEFDVTIDNKSMDITSQNQETYNLLVSLNLVEGNE